jgi:SAM-dependent methyltransferase
MNGYWVAGRPVRDDHAGMPESWRLFDGLADRFDTVVPFFTAFAEQLVALIDPVPGTCLLDVGTGRGAAARAAADRGCRVTAIDAAPRMIELLAAADPRLAARVADAHRLDLPDASFDLVTGAFVIHLVEDPAAVLAEVRRVLRPGGTVALTVPGPARDGGRWDAYRAIVDRFRDRVGPDHQPGRAPDVAGLLRAAGFVDVRAEPLDVHLPVPDPQTCWAGEMSHGFAGFVHALPPDDRRRMCAELMAELERMHADGGITFDRGAVAHLARR